MGLLFTNPNAQKGIHYMVLGSPAGYDPGLLGNLSFSHAFDSKNTFSPTPVEEEPAFIEWLARSS